MGAAAQERGTCGAQGTTAKVGRLGRGDSNGTAKNTRSGQKRQESAGREEKHPRTKALLTGASPRPEARTEPGSPGVHHPSAARSQ